MNPREIAQIVAAHIETAPEIESVEVAGPGFINIRLSDAALQGIFRVVRSEDTAYGGSGTPALKMDDRWKLLGESALWLAPQSEEEKPDE